jgi:hypothetical protein
MQALSGSNDSPSATTDGYKNIQIPGVPASVLAKRQGPTPAWEHVWQLKEEMIVHKKAYTHICLICAKDVSTKKGTKEAWKMSLYKTSTSSNAKHHIRLAHAQHPYGRAVTLEAVQKATINLNTHDTATSSNTKRSVQPGIESAMKKSRAVCADILVARWLMRNVQCINPQFEAYIWMDRFGAQHHFQP